MKSAIKDQLEGQAVDDRYRLDRRIGSGGMSVVYLAEEIATSRLVAIKFLRSAFTNLPGFVRRFEQEARACRRLAHRNCVAVLDFGVAFGSPYLAMEHVDGRTLAKRLALDGPIEARRAIRVTGQILEGLLHAHSRGVVHRDLKPGNVMVVAGHEDDDRVKIMDFGTAQILTGEPDGDASGGTDVGTPWYMAPEQAVGHATDPRTDLYAVGVMLFEMLTGERPFVAEDPMRVLQMHVSSPVPSARALRPQLGVSPELEALITRAMQKRPADRFADAATFIEQVEQVPELAPPRRTEPPRRPRRVTQAVVRPPTASVLLAAEERQAEHARSVKLWIGAGVGLLAAIAAALLLLLR